jgi:hypothetical protein
MTTVKTLYLKYSGSFEYSCLVTGLDQALFQVNQSYPIPKVTRVNQIISLACVKKLTTKKVKV